jgi:hypothetical protein
MNQNIRIKVEVADGITNDLKVNVGGNIHYTKFVVMDHKSMMLYWASHILKSAMQLSTLNFILNMAALISILIIR